MQKQMEQGIWIIIIDYDVWNHGNLIVSGE